MTDEEYLRAKGWTCAIGHTFRALDKEVREPWEHDKHGIGFTLAEAVETQLAEDRAVLAFVLERTAPRGGASRDIDPGFMIPVPEDHDRW